MALRREGAGTFVGKLTMHQVDRLVGYMAGKKVSDEQCEHPILHILPGCVNGEESQVVCVCASTAHTWEPDAHQRTSAALAQRVLGPRM